MCQEEALEPWQLRFGGDHPSTLLLLWENAEARVPPWLPHTPAASSLCCPRGNWLAYSFFIDVCPFLLTSPLPTSKRSSGHLCLHHAPVRLGGSSGLRLRTLGCHQHRNSSLSPLWTLSISRLRPPNFPPSHTHACEITFLPTSCYCFNKI